MSGIAGYIYLRSGERETGAHWQRYSLTGELGQVDTLSQRRRTVVLKITLSPEGSSLASTSVHTQVSLPTEPPYTHTHTVTYINVHLISIPQAYRNGITLKNKISEKAGVALNV